MAHEDVVRLSSLDLDHVVMVVFVFFLGKNMVLGLSLHRVSTHGISRVQLVLGFSDAGVAHFGVLSVVDTELIFSIVTY